MQQKARDNEQSLYDQLLGYFSVEIAQDRAALSEIHHVRYRVYCEEFGYEPREAFVDQEEKDEFDSRSLHCIVRHRETERVAAVSRVVTVTGDELMPIEAHCGEYLDSGFMARFADRRDTICEVSRVAVDSDFRRRRGERETRYGDTDALAFGAGERRTFPLLGLSALLCAFAYANLNGRPHAIGFMEPFLPVIMRRAGIHLTRVGEEFEFRGTRAPYYADTLTFEEGMRDEVRDFYTRIRDALRQYLPSEPGSNPHEARWAS
jgi:N-acyl amino acid synthase of PEP-CTERM/exosortase system